MYFKTYRSNIELSLSTFWSWRHDSKSFMKPVLLTPGLSFGAKLPAQNKWHVRNVMDLYHPAQNDLYKIRVQNLLSYISSGQQWKKHHLDQTNQTVNNEGKLLKYSLFIFKSHKSIFKNFINVKFRKCFILSPAFYLIM